MKTFVQLLLCLTLTFTLISCGRSSESENPDNQLTVYCSHDEVFAEEVIERFRQATGIDVTVRYDTEANKSLGLTELLISEKDNPRCDVFWNNQLLGTEDLKHHDVLEPYIGEGWSRIPDHYKDADGAYTGFAARLRVFIVNDKAGPWTEDKVAEVLAGDDLSRVALATPIYGTTLSHFAVLWDISGKEDLQQWYQSARERGIVVQGGNTTTMQHVANGTCDIGFTDTDDFFVAKDRGDSVSMLPIRVEDGKTIVIPNTVAIIKGAKNMDNAKRFVEFMLSEDNELKLAASQSRQIPLGPVDENQLNEQVKQLLQWADDAYPIAELGDARRACLQWLKAEYLK